MREVASGMVSILVSGVGLKNVQAFNKYWHIFGGGGGDGRRSAGRWVGRLTSRFAVFRSPPKPATAPWGAVADLLGLGRADRASAAIWV